MIIFLLKTIIFEAIYKKTGKETFSSILTNKAIDI